ncbi:MAG: ABC transporter ATP-binding protein [archaeon]
MNLEEIVENVFNVIFHNRRTMGSTFLRFQEHYESPKFKGKIFTLEEFKKWYIKNSQIGKKTGRFTYYSDWCGFNIPSFILNPFYEGKFNPLSPNEKKLLELFEDKKEKNFYVVGTVGEKNKDTLAHEVAHGLFYTKKEYKSKTMKFLQTIRPEVRKKINKSLIQRGYCQEVLDDEAHAYILGGFWKYISVNPKKDDLTGIRKELLNMFVRYSGINIS